MIQISCFESGVSHVSAGRRKVLLILVILDVNHKDLVNVLTGCTVQFSNILFVALNNSFIEASEKSVVMFDLWTLMRAFL